MPTQARIYIATETGKAVLQREHSGGVLLLNGSKVSHQRRVLYDGDILTVGFADFRWDDAHTVRGIFFFFLRSTKNQKKHLFGFFYGEENKNEGKRERREE